MSSPLKPGPKRTVQSYKDEIAELREALERIERHGRELGIGWCIQMAGVAAQAGKK